MQVEYKYIPFAEFKMSDGDPGTLAGYVNVAGELDDGADIVIGYDDIKGFLQGGFNTHSHDWSFSEAIGFPLNARVDDRGLWSEMKFHSTPDAQAVRTKAKERMEAGKQVGLSIGYAVSGQPIFIYPSDYERELPKYVKPDRVDATIAKAKTFSRVRVLRVTPKEFAIVTSPMNALAQAASVKGIEPEAKAAPGETDLPLTSRDSSGTATDADDDAGIIPPEEKEKSMPTATDADAEKGSLITSDALRSKFNAHLPKTMGDYLAKAVITRAPAGEAFNDLLAKMAEGAGLQPSVINDALNGQTESLTSAHLKSFAALLDIPDSVLDVFNIKGLYEQTLAEQFPPVWMLIDTFHMVVCKLRQAAELASDAGMPFDVMALKDEALAEFMRRMDEAVTRMLAEAADEGMMPMAMTYAGVMADEAKAIEALFAKGPRVGLTAEAHTARVLDCIKGLADRFQNHASLRRLDGKEGRTISAATRGRIKQLISAIDTAAPQMQTLRDGLQELYDMGGDSPKSNEVALIDCSAELTAIESTLFAQAILRDI